MSKLLNDSRTYIGCGTTVVWVFRVTGETVQVTSSYEYTQPTVYFSLDRENEREFESSPSGGWGMVCQQMGVQP